MVQRVDSVSGVFTMSVMQRADKVSGGAAVGDQWCVLISQRCGVLLK